MYIVTKDEATGSLIMTETPYFLPKYSVGDCLQVKYNERETPVTIKKIEMVVGAVNGVVYNDTTYTSIADIIFKEDDVIKIIRKATL